jgi:hypothetical protein
MRRLVRTALALAIISIVGCQRSTPIAPDQASPAQALSQSGNTTAAAMGKPEIDPTYANGATVYMIG